MQARLLPPSLASTYKIVGQSAAPPHPSAQCPGYSNSSLGLSLSSDDGSLSAPSISNNNSSKKQKPRKSYFKNTANHSNNTNRSVSPIVNNLVDSGEGVVFTTKNRLNPFKNLTSSLGSAIIQRPSLAESYSRIIRDDEDSDREHSPGRLQDPCTNLIPCKPGTEKLNKSPSSKYEDSSSSSSNDSSSGSNSSSSNSNSSSSSSGSSTDADDSSSSSSSDENVENDMTIGEKIAYKVKMKQLKLQKLTTNNSKVNCTKKSKKIENSVGPNHNQPSTVQRNAAAPEALVSGWCNVCGTKKVNKPLSWWYSLDTSVPEIPQISIRVALRVSHCRTL